MYLPLKRSAYLQREVKQHADVLWWAVTGRKRFPGEFFQP